MDEFICQCRVETNQVAGVLCARKTFGSGRLYQRCVGRKLNRLSFDFDRQKLSSNASFAMMLPSDCSKAARIAGMSLPYRFPITGRFGLIR